MKSAITIVLVFTTIVVTVVGYLVWIRPWQLRWGATDAEIEREMPGDEIVDRPTFNATRGVTIEAPPEAIWPWIVQMGFGRAGWYSYDWIDNLGKPSAERIIPKLQDLSIGDLIPMGPGGLGLRVKAVEVNRSMLWGDDNGDVTWAWGIYPMDEERTRLITRVRIQYHWTRPSILFNLLLDVGDIIMMRKCMLGIKQRAEALARQNAN